MYVGIVQLADVSVDEHFGFFLQGLCMVLVPVVLISFSFPLARTSLKAKAIQGMCTECGYDLRGLPDKPGQTCPECGAVIDAMKRLS